MKIDIKKLFVTLLPFLYSLATRVWAKAPSEIKEAATQAVNAVQIIKQHIDDEPEDIYQAVKNFSGIPIEVIELVLPLSKIEEIQNKVNSKLEDLEYNQLWKSLAEQLANGASPAPIDWKSFAYGLIEIAYEVLFKK